MKVKGKNVFVNYLALLGVRHTNTYSNQTYNEHPHKNNFYGLSKMLYDYNIENAAVRIANKEQIFLEIPLPFIAQFNGDFVSVYKSSADKVHFIWKNKNHILTAEKFIEAWTGVVLIAESSEKSCEPNYKEHCKVDFLVSAKKTLLISALSLIVVFVYINNYIIPSSSAVIPLEVEKHLASHKSFIGITLLLFLCLSGVFISWLLLLKQMHLQSLYADKICSLFKQKGCNNVLESEASKFFGIGWAEIGFAYFLSNVILLLVNPFEGIYTFIALLNIFTLPFTIWSIWYQKTKAKQWCILCIIVLALLWAIFIVNYSFRYLQLYSFINWHLFFVCCCYIVAILGINQLITKLGTVQYIQSLRQSINTLKADEDVFKTLLKKQPFYETNNCDSIISFGTPGSKLQITVLTSLYCNPCSKLHKRIEELLLKTSNSISVHYILSSFNEKLNSTNKYLIATCLENKTVSVLQLLSSWFEKGKQLRDDYFKNLSINMDNPLIEVEFQKHINWNSINKLRATPTILVNGYLLPDHYKVEDLRYFTNIKL